jgi:hypothetical protein
VGCLVFTAVLRIGFLVLRKLGKSSFQAVARKLFLLVCCVLGLLFLGCICNRRRCIPTGPFFIPRCVTWNLCFLYKVCWESKGFSKKEKRGCF